MSDAIKNVLNYSRGYSTGALWGNINMEFEGGSVTFEKQAEDFFSMLRAIMEGRGA